MKRAVILIAVVAALSGCSSFKLGAFCYVPAGGGQCAAAAMPVSNLPQASADSSGI